MNIVLHLQPHCTTVRLSANEDQHVLAPRPQWGESQPPFSLCLRGKSPFGPRTSAQKSVNRQRDIRKSLDRYHTVSC